MLGVFGKSYQQAPLWQESQHPVTCGRGLGSQQDWLQGITPDTVQIGFS
ncbi:hypothetical protein Q427_08355 [Halomonas sp. BC04]|nr:hypothetical protein Q427_08355 [Halomonas sp. BC04]